MRTLSLFCLILCAPLEAGEIWPAFRGEGATDFTADDLPHRWSPDENIAWRSALPGYGQSSPVIWRNQIYVTAVEGAQKETNILVALSIDAGDTLWSKRFTSNQPGANNPMMSRAAPSPVVDEQGLYAFFESGDLCCVDHEGDVQWQRSLVNDFGPIKNHHGLGSSLAQTDDCIIVLVDHSGPSYLLAVDKQTGRDRWKAERASCQSWTSPLVVNIGGESAIVASGGGVLSCYDAANGQLWWKVDGLCSNDVPSPVISDQCVFLAGGSNPLKPSKDFTAKSNCCVRLSRDQPQVIWHDSKLFAYHASPIVHAGHVYIVARNGLLHCLNAETGEKRYSARLDGTSWATPIAAGERIYFFGKDGITSVIKAGASFELIASNQLWSDRSYVEAKIVAQADPQNKVLLPPAPPEMTREMELVLDEAVGDVVYGVAAVSDAFFIWTGTRLYCIREQ